MKGTMRRNGWAIGLAIIFLCGVTAGGAFAQEEQLLAEVSTDELRRHATEIVKHVRPSGSPGEFAAVDYIVSTLRSESILVEVYEFPAYVSDPVSATFEVVGGKSYEALTQAFAAPTETGVLRGELVDCGDGTAQTYAAANPRGKIALVNGLPGPDSVKALAKTGATGGVFVSASERINEMTVSPVWGTPTHKDYTEMPSIPTVAVNRETGEELRNLLGSGSVEVRLKTQVDTGWKPLRLAVASIPSQKDPDGFVLVGGHIDAWHYGATDEGSSNAAMVELARIFHRHRGKLERGMKVAWWPGHSNGRYAGSTWYADRFWTELKDHAIAYLNLDVIGQIDAKVYSAACTAELDGLAKSVMKDVVGVDGRTRRPSRNSDQSFYGIGLPLLQFYHDRLPEDGGYWFWHTTEDTFDKIDFDNLAAETRLYVAALYRLLTASPPPFDIAAATRELKQRLEEKASAPGAAELPFPEVLQRAERLHGLATSLQDRLSSDSQSWRQLVRILRPLTRITFDERGPYHQDPALGMSLLPGLSSLSQLEETEPQSDLYRFTQRYLVRELNRIADHLDQAIEEAERLTRL
jgi:Iap family predicted aminopeptidase